MLLHRIDIGDWSALPNLKPYATAALLWVGLLVPTGFIETRQAGAVVDDPLTAITVVRGLLPAVCLLLVLLIARPPLLPQDRREWALASYLLVVAMSAGWSLAPLATALKAGHLGVSYALLVILARSWSTRRQALNQLAGVAYGVVVLAAVAAVLAPDLAFTEPIYGEPDGRLLSVIPRLQPVVLGMVCALALVFAFGRAGPTKMGRAAAFRAFIGILAACTLVLTGTRTPGVLALLGALTYALLSRNRLATAQLAALVLAGLALVLSPLGESLRTRLQPEVAVEALRYLGGRLPMWQGAWDVASERPFIGYGYYAGHRLGPYEDFFRANIDPERVVYVDGTYTETLLDVGLLGLGCLVAFIVICAAQALASRSGGGSARALHVGALVVGALWSVQDYTVQQVGIPMVLVAGLLLAPTPFRTTPAARSVIDAQVNVRAVLDDRQNGL